MTDQRPRYTGNSRHGTQARYLWELKNGGSCPVCREANRAKAAKARDDARVREAQRALTLAGVSKFTGLDPDALKQSQGSVILDAVNRDLGKANEARPGFLTNAAMARMLARTLDDDKSPAAKAPLVKALGDTMREIFGIGGIQNDSFEGFLDELGTPIVMPSKVLDPEEPPETDTWA